MSNITSVTVCVSACARVCVVLCVSEYLCKCIC